MTGAIPPPLLARLEHQLDALDLLLALSSPGALEARPAPGEWSARENLAHLARHQAVFLDRLRRLLEEPCPDLGRYRAEEDPEWPEWERLSAEAAIGRLRALRAELLGRLRALTPGEARRTGRHPTFGELDVRGWLEFLLVHEAHHLYVALFRVGQARPRA